MKTIIGILLVILTTYQIHQAQNTPLQGDENHALIHVKVTNMEDAIRPNNKIIFVGEKGQTLEGQTNMAGEFDILLPEGDTYLIQIVGLGEKEDYSKIAIGSDEGVYEGSITIKYEPAKSYTLDDVHFDTGKSSLRPESYACLNKLVAALQLQAELNIEIAGHTDSRGNDNSNLTLSQERAEAVVAYLISKGIDAKRLAAKGYGETQPIADNETTEGRQQNRRTEARILD